MLSALAIAQYAAIFSVLTALLGALLVLGTNVVIQRTEARLRLYWFAFLATLFGTALGLGVLAVVISIFA